MPFDRDAIQALLQDPKAPATALLVALMDEYGTEMLGWDPYALRLEIEHEFRVKLPHDNMDKVNALVTVLTTNQMFVSLDAFCAVCTALFDRGTDSVHMDLPSVEEMCWAITEVHLLDAPPDKYNDDIVTYATERLKLEGWTRAPGMLRRVTGNWQGADNLSINDTLEDSGGDVAAYWKGAEGKEQELNADIMNRLKVLADTLVRLPLQHGQRQVLEQLQQNVGKALAGLSRDSSPARAPLAAP